MLRLKKLEISGGCLFILALLFYFDEQWLLLRAIPACIAHECGHLAAIHLLNGEVRSIRIGITGAEIKMAGQLHFSYWGEILTAAAGPVVNLVLAYLTSPVFPVFGGVNLILGLFNLLPVLPMDGGRIIYYGLSMVLGEDRALRFSQRWAVLAATATGTAGGIVLWRSGYNFTLLLIGIWLLLLLRKGKGVVKRRRNGYNGTK